MNDFQSAEVKELFAAVSKMQGELENAQKNAKNPHFKSDYANLDAVITTSKEPLAKFELSVIQTMNIIGEGLVLVTTLAHSSGQYIRSITPIFNDKGNAQGMGSGISYARRYALAAIIGLTQTDDDGNDASSDKNASGPQSKPQTPFVKPALAQTKHDPWQMRIPKGWKQNGGKSLEEIGTDGVYKLSEWLKRQETLSPDSQKLLAACEDALISGKTNGSAKDVWP